MFKNYLKVAFRNLWKHKAFSGINIFGLSLGMTCFFLVLLYLRHEHNYDRFHEQLDRLYQVTYTAHFGDEPIELARVPLPISPVLPDYFPEVEASARLFPRNISVTVPETQEQYEITDGYFADSTIFQLFSFDFVGGDPLRALHQPYSVVLTEEQSIAFFGSTDVIGKSLRLVDRDEFRVTAVIKEWPENAHLRFSMLVNYDNMFDLEPEGAREPIRQNLTQNWIASHSHTYVLLREGARMEAVNEKFKAFLDQYGNEQYREKQAFSLYPVADIHLYSEASIQASASANRDYLRLFFIIGLITLLIACINFINLSTASSLGRAKEVGVRKVLGAARSRLVRQFIGESLLLCFISFLVSLLLIDLLLPYLNDLTGTVLHFDLVSNWQLLALFVVIFILAGFLAGSYPAFFVSRFRPVSVLKGSTGTSQQPKGDFIRKALITIQFIGAIGFIGATFVVYKQLHYMRNQPLGFQKDQILSVPVFSSSMNALFRPGDPEIRQRMNALDEALLRNPNIEEVTQCSQQPGFGGVRRRIWTDEITPDDNIFLTILAVDYDFAETFQLELLAGREFDQSYGTDHTESFVINEQTLGELGWDSPEKAVGKPLTVEGKQGKVVGVIKDFHVSSLRDEIQPLILEVRAGAFHLFLYSACEMQSYQKLLISSKSSGGNFSRKKPSNIPFWTNHLDNLYTSESRLSRIIGYFAFIAIFISCFGLFGLAALATRQRAKEIGIRKILGASVSQLMNLLASDFMKLIAIAMLIALPLTWYLVANWLEDFAFRIDMPWWLFLLAGLGALLIAFLDY